MAPECNRYLFIGLLCKRIVISFFTVQCYANRSTATSSLPSVRDVEV